MTIEPDAAPPARRLRFSPPFGRRFYDRSTAAVARDLLGAWMECRVDGVLAGGWIVEVEAYLGPHDPACHAVAGVTPRTRHLHGPPGTAYVYRIYGRHWCVNAVTREAGHGSAVLIRAIAPAIGLSAVRQRRGGLSDRQLANGPGKLCQALGIDGSHDGTRLDRGPVRLRPGRPVAGADVVVTPRIGISRAADWPLRYCIAGDPHVSPTPRHFPRSTVEEASAWRRARALR